MQNSNTISLRSFLYIHKSDLRNEFFQGEKKESSAARAYFVLRCIANDGPPMESILFHTESPAFRAVALDPRSRNRRKTCSRERHTRLHDEVEENESEMYGERRVREVAAGIKHKTVYIHVEEEGH